MRKVYHLPLFIFWLLIILLLQHNNSLAQDTGTLRGLVTDSTTAEVLPFSSAYIKELKIGANTDTRGYFLITSVPANQNYTLIVSYIGYKTRTLTIRVSKGKLSHYNINLVPANIQMKTIESVGERINATDSKISIDRISAKQLESTPKGVESDVFRTIKYLPGVTATSDVSARYFVRGGTSDQNLVLIDGITIYNPFHALGLFSVVDPDIVNSIEFFKGGFSAQFGGRLSSVMNISTKDGNKNRFSSKLSGSFLSGKFLVEGPIADKGSFIITGRKSFSNQIIKKFLNENNIPVDFYDVSFKANYLDANFLPGSKFSVSGFTSSDNLINIDPQIEDYNWKSSAFGFKWFQASDAPLFFELGLSVSNFKGATVPKFSGKTPLENKVSDLALKMDFTYVFDNRDEVNVGFHIQQIATNLFFNNALGTLTTLNTSGADIIFYGRYKVAQFDFFKLDFGTRVNLTTLTRNADKKNLEPRINLTLVPFSNFSIKGSVGLFQQELTTINDENEVINIFEPWVVIPDYLPPTTATHYIIGFDYVPFPSLNLGMEYYYKRTNNLPIVNREKIATSDKDFINGEGESYGVESSIKFNYEPVTFSTAYTLAYAYKTVDGLRYYPKYDIRHSFNASLEFNIGNGWSTGVVWTFNTGLPFTQIVGFYDKYYFDNIFSSWDTFDPRRPYGMLGVQNIERLPTYHRLDFTVSKKIILDPFNVDLSFSIINVYNRQNIFYYKRDTGERVNMLPFLPTATIKIEL